MKHLKNIYWSASFVLLSTYVGEAQTVVDAEIYPIDEVKAELFEKGTSIVNLLPNIGYSSLSDNQSPKQTTNHFKIRY